MRAACWVEHWAAPMESTTADPSVARRVGSTVLMMAERRAVTMAVSWGTTMVAMRAECWVGHSAAPMESTTADPKVARMVGSTALMMAERRAVTMAVSWGTTMVAMRAACWVGHSAAPMESTTADPSVARRVDLTVLTMAAMWGVRMVDRTVP